jgi:hypothetical protein
MEEALFRESFIVGLKEREHMKSPVDESPTADPESPVRMKSVDRVSKLPVVEETLKLAFNFYGKLKVRVSHFL